METAAQSPRLEIRLLGPFDVRINSRPLRRLRTRKGQFLLALLALRQSKAVEREWLTATLWPESDDKQAYYNLRRALHDLRAAVGPFADLISSPTPHSLCLEASDDLQIDVVRFDPLVRSEDPDSLRKAVELYRGPLLEGCPEEWITPEREAREQDCLRALEKLAERAAEQGEWSEVVRRLRLVITTDPFREEAQRALMEALARTGSPAGATLAYREFRSLLRREVNVEPSPETTAVYQRLRRQADAAPARPDTRARDLLPLSHGNLPVPVTTFIGRDHEKRTVHSLLHKHRLVTLVGAGGCGKTRLALEVESEMRASFDDRACWVELAPISDPALAWHAVASSLSIPEVAGRRLSDSVCRVLEGQRRLVILDNCEHLINGVAEVASLLIQRCPRISILATSREPLDVAGEVTWRVPSLSTPKWSERELSHSKRCSSDLATLMQFESVRLFADRAALAEPRFQVTEENGPAVAQVCSRLDGIPLAIELAASRVTTLTTEQIAARLDDRFRLLKWNRRDVLPRQQTLRALIDWSYSLLTDMESALFRRLAVFAGGFTLEAVESVCPVCDGRCDTAGTNSARLDPFEIVEILSRLVDKSMIVFEASNGPGGRYRLLETIREYALERLKVEGEYEDALAKHFSWCLQLAEAARPEIRKRDQMEWLERLDDEHDNIRAALAFGTHQTPQGPGRMQADAEQTLRLAAAMGDYWRLKGHLTEGRDWLNLALAQEGANEPSKARADALRWAGMLARDQSDHPSTRACDEESLRLYRRLGEEEGIAMVLSSMGLTAWCQGDFAAASSLQEDALAISRKLGNTYGIARCLNNLGIVRWHQGEYPAARTILEECLTLGREIGDRLLITNALINLSAVSKDLGNLDAALKMLEECRTIRLALGDKIGLSNVFLGLGMLASIRGYFSEATAHFENCIKLSEELGDQQAVADGLLHLGMNAILEGDLCSARGSLADCIRNQHDQSNVRAILQLSEVAACFAAADGSPEASAPLFGFAAAQRELLKFPVRPSLSASYGKGISAAHMQLGEKAFAQAYSRGAGFSCVEALEEATRVILWV